MKTTLLDLVQAVSAVCDDDRVVVAVVRALINGGHARLAGSFRGTRVV